MLHDTRTLTVLIIIFLLVVVMLMLPDVEPEHSVVLFR